MLEPFSLCYEKSKFRYFGVIEKRNIFLLIKEGGTK